MLIFRPSEFKCFKYSVQIVMGMFLPSGLLKCIFLFSKTAQDLLCVAFVQYLLNPQKSCFQSKHSKMNVALQWNVSIVLEVFLLWL